MKIKKKGPWNQKMREDQDNERKKNASNMQASGKWKHERQDDKRKQNASKREKRQRKRKENENSKFKTKNKEPQHQKMHEEHIFSDDGH